MSELTPKSEVMRKFGFTDPDGFDTLLLDLNIDPDLSELTDEQVEAIKNHVTVFATSLTVLPASEETNGNGYSSQNSENGNHSNGQASDNDNSTYSPPAGSMKVITNQGLQIAKETGLQINQGALETLCQLTFDKGRLDAAFIENAYWLGLLRQQNQLRAENTEKLIKILQTQQNQNVDIEKLAKEAGLLSNEELVKKLSGVAQTETQKSSTSYTVSAATNW